MVPLSYRGRPAVIYVVANPLRGDEEVPRSTGHIMVTTCYLDQQGSKSRQKVMRLYKRWHRPITKRFIKPFLLHIESSLDRVRLLSPTHDQTSILLLPRVMVYYIVSVLFFLFFWCPCMAINNVSVQYNGGLLSDILVLTQCYFHRGTRLNAIKRFCIRVFDPT